MTENAKKNQKKSKYVGMSDDLIDFQLSLGVKEKLKSGAKLFGKGLLNAGIFTATEIVPGIFKQAQKNAEEVKKKRDSQN
jgi:hypothetical protein